MPKSKSGILDIIFPPRCAFCRGLLKRGESGMCAECAKSLPYTSPSERAGTDFVAACVAPLRYEGAVREALHRYKFQGVTAYAGVFGRLVADCIRERLAGEYELISWVPLSSQRLKERGYDQAMLIAMAAALEPDCIAECDEYYCEVDTSNGPSYGGVLVDTYRFSGKQPNAAICSKLHADRFKEYLFRTLGA